MDMQRVRTVWTGVAGAPYYTNLYFNDTTGASGAQDAVTAVDTFWTAISGNIEQNCDYVIEPFVAVIGSTEGALVDGHTTTGETGGGTYVGEMLPRQVQGLVRWDTGVIVGGRYLRGRTFIPCIGEPINTTGGVPTTAFATLVNTAAAALIADTGNELVIWSRTHGVAHPATLGTFQPQWATLNSRRD